jgi:hypothetical protein
MPPPSADPFQPPQQPAELLFDPRKLTVEQVEIGILAIVVNHEAGNPVHHSVDPCRIPFAQPAERPRRIGKVEPRGREPRVQAQAACDMRRGIVEAFQLRDRVEDDLVGIAHRLVDLVIGPADGIGMRLAAEVLAPEPEFKERRRGGPVHVLSHLVEDAPGGKAFQRQQHLRARSLTQVVHHRQIPRQFRAVDQVIGRLDHGKNPPRGQRDGRKRGI